MASGIAIAALTGPHAHRCDAAQEPTIRTYREPDDPVQKALQAAVLRLGSEKGDAEEAATLSLRDLDQAIQAHASEPRLHWFRGVALSGLKRVAEARASRDEAIRLARLWPGGGDMLPALYIGHAESCAEEGDPAAAAASFLAQLDLGPDRTRPFESLADTLREPSKGPRVAPGPGPNFPDVGRLEASWGPLAKFFEKHGGPKDAASLKKVAEQVREGMDYREVAHLVGFPSIAHCEWDHGIPDRDACWEYKIVQPTIARDGDFVAADPHADQKTVHVVILDGRVRKVETTQGHPPEEKTYPHGERASFAFDRNSIESVAFSPDGALVAAGDLWGAVHLREARDGHERSVLRVPGADKEEVHGSATSLAFSPDGARLAMAGLYDGTVRVWDLATGRPGFTLEVLPIPKNQGRMDHVESIAFSPDGKILATAGYSAEVKLWDAATGRLAASLQGQPDQTHAVAFSPDGKTLASGGEDGSLILWDVAASRPRDRLPGYEIPVNSLAFSPDGRTLAVGRSDGNHGTVRLLDLANNRWRATIHVGFGYRFSLAFSPDGKTIAVADAAWRVATLWDTASGRRVGTLEGHRRDVNAVAFSPNGKTIATGGPDGLKLWDVPAPIDQGRPVKP